MIDLRIFAQQSTVDALAWTLLHFLWQGALIGVAAFALLRLARPERASTRYAIGVATLAVMLMCCITTFAMLSTEARPIDAAVSRVAMSGAAIEVKPAIDEIVRDGEGIRTEQSSARGSSGAFASWRPAPLGPTASFVLVLAWGIGVLALSLRLLGGWMLTRSLTRHAISAVSPAIVEAARVIGERLGVRRAVAILESGAVAVPTLVGWVKPVVLLPAAALSGLSPDQLEAILAHELAHVRRHDYLVNLLQSMVETLLFYHPATWWVSAQVRAEREHCCDDLAVEVCGDRLVYVSALAELTSITSHRAFVLAATDGSIVGRVRRILGSPRSVHEPAPAWALLALVVLLAGGIGSSSTITSAAVVVPTSIAEKNPTPPTIVASSRVRKENDATPISAQRFRHWFDSAPPPPPPAPPAPPAPDAPFAPMAPPAPPAVDGPVAPLGLAPPPFAPEMPDAPRAPEAPTAPRIPEPPAPPDPPQEIGSRGSGNMTWSNNGDKISINWSGGFRLSDDEKDIAWMEDGARLTISDGASEMQLRGVNGRIERTYTRNGSRRDYEPEGRAFLAGALDRLIKNSAAFAKDRVAKFLKRGGPDAVLVEIDKLGKSSYTHRIYYTELTRQATLSESLLTRILQRVPTEMSSDYDKATLFIAIAALPAITEPHRVQIARAVQTISSDYDQRRTLGAIMDARPLSPALTAAVLDAAGSIKSNYDRSLVLQEVVERGGVTAANGGAFAALVQSMSSSYEKRRVLTALAANRGVAKEALAEAIKSSSSLGSSHDQSETLIKLVDSGALTEASADSFFQSASQISSSYDLSRVLRRVVDQPGMDDRILERLLRTAPRVSGSYDRANLLEAIASHGKVTGTSRQLYVDATAGMGSHDSNRALAALVRAER